MEEKPQEDTIGIKVLEVKKTNKKGLSKFLSQTFRRSAAPDNSITKQTTNDTQWIRKEPDEDGYFLVQLKKTIGQNDMFLTAEDASSLTVACK